MVLAITQEDPSIVKKFLSQRKITYPVLLDPGRKVTDLFRLDGFPESFVYDRQGRLVAHAPGRPAMRGFLEMLGEAGLVGGDAVH